MATVTAPWVTHTIHRSVLAVPYLALFTTSYDADEGLDFRRPPVFVDD